MNPRALLALSIAISVLAGCMTATTITSRQRIDKEVAGKLAVREVDATSAVGRFTPSDVDQLKQAVQTRVVRTVEGGVPATVRLVVTALDTGAFGGTTRMSVSVRVLDASGKTLADFNVQRTANAAVGALFDQKTSVIDAVADGVEQALTGNIASSAPQLTRD